jgi:hypothetical protein
MLVAIINAISWEVFESCCDSVILKPSEISDSADVDTVRIIPVAPGVGDGISRMQIEVNNRRETPADADSARLERRYAPNGICHFSRFIKFGNSRQAHGIPERNTFSCRVWPAFTIPGKNRGKRNVIDHFFNETAKFAVGPSCQEGSAGLCIYDLPD